MEKREVTARVKVRLKENSINVKSVNASIYEELTIISKAIVMLGFEKHSELSSYEYEWFDGEDPCVCMAFNIETHELQISVNDLPEIAVLGILEYAKQVVLKDLLGENNAS